MHAHSERNASIFVCPRRRGAGLSSFTLVEVVIAIGVTAFGLISIFGLMAYVAQTIQQSDKYARLSTVTSQILATVGSEEFASSPYATGVATFKTAAKCTNFYYYTFEGLPTNSANGTSVYYQCSVSDATPVGFATNIVGTGQPVMEPLQITIMWPKPATAGTPFANTNIIVTSVLNYESL